MGASRSAFDSVNEAAKVVLVVDDDETFRERLARALSIRGFVVVTAKDHPTAVAKARRIVPSYAVVDLKMPGASGLEVVRDLAALSRRIRTLVLTGYGSISSAVQAEHATAATDALGPGVGRAGLRFYGIGDRPATDDGALTAPGFTQFDMHLGYRHRRFDIAVDLESLLNGTFRSAQFSTVSRLRNEPATGAAVPASFSCGNNARLAPADGAARVGGSGVRKWIICGIEEKPGPNGSEVAGTAVPMTPGESAPKESGTRAR